MLSLLLEFHTQSLHLLEFKNKVLMELQYDDIHYIPLMQFLLLIVFPQHIRKHLQEWRLTSFQILLYRLSHYNLQLKGSNQYLQFSNDHHRFQTFTSVALKTVVSFISPNKFQTGMF